MRIKDLHVELKLQQLSDRRHCHTLEYVYRCQNGLAPEQVANQLTLVASTDGRETRAMARQDLSMPNFELEIFGAVLLEPYGCVIKKGSKSHDI